jgi:hypothetical protein
MYHAWVDELCVQNFSPKTRKQRDHFGGISDTFEDNIKMDFK